MNSDEIHPEHSRRIRESFLRFFEERGHKRLPSAPLVPLGDPTLLFTSAGMVQFKPYFLGQAKPPRPRLTTVQKCFRTTDIDAVGDASHLTFFEMLGNFSVGDYFKEEAIPWAWEYVTGKDWLGLDPDRLWAAVYLDDDEAFDLWRKVGVPAERIRRYGEEHNYWFSGEVGPCGPCSEIHYDFGPQFGCGPDCEPDHEDCGRFLEIWNLVFMTYFQHADGSRTPLPAKNIDTGAGLERIAAAKLFESAGWDKTKRPSVYDTDLFAPIVGWIQELSQKRYGDAPATDRAMRIVAEHARAITFLIGDERTPVLPANEKQGYVLRRLLRKVTYYSQRFLRMRESNWDPIVTVVVQTMRDAYPELGRTHLRVMDVVQQEADSFGRTLDRGSLILEDILRRNEKRHIMPGDEAFVLHDTYGFPLELTREIARERGFTVDEAGFQAEMEKQRERARAADKGTEGVGPQAYAGLGDIEATFLGYETLTAETTVLAIIPARAEPVEARAPIDSVAAPAEIEVVLGETPFYPEGGGQVGDRGEILGPNGRLAVEDTQRVAERLIVHRGRVVEGRIAVGDAVTAQVDPQHREDTMRNHTGTHLLHAALRQVLGTHVRQSGSLVAPDRLRFDFTHTEALTPEQLAEVQRLVNEKVRQNLPVDTRYTTYEQAISEGVLAFFGEKYGDEVRVVEVDSIVPKFSAELCGGTHCQRTGDIGFLLIVGESSIGAGMRRVEALTGRGAEEYVRGQLASLDEMARRLGASREALAARLDSLLGEQDTQRKKIERLERSLATAPTTEQLLAKAIEVDGVRVLAAAVDAPSPEAFRYIGDAVRNGLGSGAAVLGSVIDGKPSFLAIVTRDLTGRLHAGELLRRVAAVAGGGGGGRPEMAQGGGKDPAKLDEALGQVPQIVREMLKDEGT